MTRRSLAVAIVPPTAVAAGGAFLAGLALAGAGAHSVAFYVTGLLFAVAATGRSLSVLGDVRTAGQAQDHDPPDQHSDPSEPRAHGDGKSADESIDRAPPRNRSAAGRIPRTGEWPMGTATESAVRLSSGSVAAARSSDEQLVAMMRQGDEDALAVLIARYQPALLSLSRALVGTAYAEDVVQETWLRVHSAVSGGRGPQSLRPWLYALARRASLDFLRKSRTSAPEELMGNVELDSLPAATSEADLASVREEWREAVMAMHRLPERQRSALVMSLEGLTFREIADAMELSEAQIGLLLHRSRKTLWHALSTRADPATDASGSLDRDPSGGAETDAATERPIEPPPIESVDDFLREVLAQAAK